MRKAEKRAIPGRAGSHGAGPSRTISRFVVVAVVSLALFSFSCTQSVSLDNPFDPAVALNPPTNLELVYLGTDYVSLSWQENNLFTNQTQEHQANYIIETGTDTLSFDTLDVMDAVRQSQLFDATFSADSIYYFRVAEVIGGRFAGTTNIVMGKP
jgi:hypothetical protein